MEQQEVFNVKQLILSDEEKGEIFLEIEHASYKDVAIKSGVAKFYKTPEAASMRIGKIYTEVCKNPERYGVSQEAVDRITLAKEARQNSNINKTPTNAEKILPVEQRVAAIETKDVALKDLVITVRDKALKLVNAKLDEIGMDIESVKLTELTTAFGTIFDKARIIQGEATENIAILAKIDKNMSPEDALAAVLTMKDRNQTEKEEDRKVSKLK